MASEHYLYITTLFSFPGFAVRTRNLRLLSLVRFSEADTVSMSC